MRVVAHCPNLIGDTVMATPTLRALREGLPGARIDVVVKPQVAPVLDGLPWIDRRLLFDPRSDHPELSAWNLRKQLQAGNYDLGLLLPNSMRSAIMFRLGRVRRIVGYARGGRGVLLNVRLTPPLEEGTGRFLPTPAVEYYAALARAVDCPVKSLRPELFTTEEDEAATDGVWRSLGLGEGRAVACLNTGGAFGPAKNWPAEYFGTLARRLAEEASADVLVICGPSEREAARRIVGLARHERVFSLAEQTLSLGLSKACVKRSAMMVTTDSGPRHFAAAFGVPVISLFGPTHIAWTRTYHPRALHLQQPVSCGPCQKPVCPEGHHRCMRELEPETVFRAAIRFLPKPGTKRQEEPGLLPGEGLLISC